MAFASRLLVHHLGKFFIGGFVSLSGSLLDIRDIVWIPGVLLT